MKKKSVNNLVTTPKIWSLFPDFFFTDKVCFVVKMISWKLISDGIQINFGFVEKKSKHIERPTTAPTLAPSIWNLTVISKYEIALKFEETNNARKALYFTEVCSLSWSVAFYQAIHRLKLRIFILLALQADLGSEILPVCMIFSYTSFRDISTLAFFDVSIFNERHSLTDEWWNFVNILTISQIIFQI